MPDSDLGAELEVETSSSTSNNVQQLNRRCSYEEVVHQDDEDERMEQDQQGSLAESAVSSGSNNSEHSLVLLTQWALILQEITDDNDKDKDEHPERNVQKSRSYSCCLCKKFDALKSEFVRLESLFHEVVDLHQEAEEHEELTTELARCVKMVGDSLRSGISIQVSNPSDEIKQKAIFLVAQIQEVHR